MRAIRRLSGEVENEKSRRFVGAHGTPTNYIVVVNLLTGAFEITMVGDINFGITTAALKDV